MLGTAAFGKLERHPDGALYAWLPLTDHLIDVAACLIRLCHCQSIRRALECAAERTLTDPDVARLGALAFLHDVGKANSGFQARRWLWEAIPAGWPKPVPPIGGHGPQALDLFRDEPFLEPLQACLPLEQISGWGEAVIPLFRASISHHAG